jgi:hypothetical protein
MGHFYTDEKHRAASTPKAWLPVGAQIGTLANEWSKRSDIVTYVGPGAGGSAPACFIPAKAELELNIDVAFGEDVDPRDIDLTTRTGRYEFPRGIGLIAHEAFHAKHSTWDIPQMHKDLAKDEAVAFMLLEEARIEFLGLQALPKMLPFLRASAMEIAVGDINEIIEKAEMSNTDTMAQLVGLVYGRIDAGILDFRDVVAVTDLVDEYFGLEKIAALRDIALAFQAHTQDADGEAVYPLAREWARLIRETKEEKGESAEQGEPGESGEPGEGGEGSEGGTSVVISKELMDAIMDAMGEAAEEAEISANDDLAQAEQGERYEEIVEIRAKDAKERGAAEAEAGKIFTKSTGPGTGDRTHSRLRESRPPTGAERVAANHIARLLEKAKYHDRDVTEVNTILPPGRLNARALVQGVAQRERGMLVQAEPWRKKVRRHTDEPTLTVGFMADISGSMEDAMEPMAVMAYVMSEAARRVQARTAAVYYGNSVFHSLRPGEHLRDVRIYSAPDMTEEFSSAFKALDGALNLLHGTGGRLLVIVSDCCYTDYQTQRAKHWIQRCAEEGVAVVILPFDSGDYVYEVRNSETTVLAGRFNPVDAAAKVGQACADALTRAGARRG